MLNRAALTKHTAFEFGISLEMSLLLKMVLCVKLVQKRYTCSPDIAYLAIFW